MKTAPRPLATGVQAEAWVTAYKLSHPEANRWASGPGRVQHSVETQERVFRMVEQLSHWRALPPEQPVFSVLESLDDVAEGETDAVQAHVSPSVAAAAGIVAYKMIFGDAVAVDARGWPSHVELVEDGEADLVLYGLRAGGFDPILFDGTDPAAFTWALFELRQRKADASEAARAYVHGCPRPCAVAVVATAPVQITPAPKQVRELAGLRG